jgi:hypothetical protein
MSGKAKDFGLAGVTDKLKRGPGKSETLIQDKGKPDEVVQVKGESNAVESVTVLTEKVEPITVLPEKGELDFRQEALARLNKPSAKVLQQAIEVAKRKPRIGVYSPIVSAAAEYLRESIPKYSASDEARKILEDEFERRYPELIQRIKAEMNNGR